MDYDLLLGRLSEENARRCAQLEQERDEARLLTAELQASLSKYEDVLKIPSIDVQISGLKLGGGAFGGNISPFSQRSLNLF